MMSRKPVQLQEDEKEEDEEDDKEEGHQDGLPRTRCGHHAHLTGREDMRPVRLYYLSG
jgi:hypothetical protein